MTEQLSGKQIRLMTYNIGGGRKDLGSDFEAIENVIASASPEVIFIQEVMERWDADGGMHSQFESLSGRVLRGFHHYYGPTLSLSENLHVSKDLMVDAVFRDWRGWRQGNAVFSRWGFVRLSDPTIASEPTNVPVYRPPVYEGNRDTDPRYAILTRIDLPPLFPYIVGVHLTTLVGERGSRAIPGRQELAEKIRYGQAKRLLDLLQRHVLEPRRLVFLLGDFNAPAGEAAISAVLEGEGGFLRLVPESSPISTHPKVPDAVDHIFVYPPERVKEYSCKVIDSRASDHCPVVADVVISTE